MLHQKLEKINNAEKIPAVAGRTETKPEFARALLFYLIFLRFNIFM